jgi:signal transduction histidine kinase/ligand-binding sensor domain-containing protein
MGRRMPAALLVLTLLGIAVPPARALDPSQQLRQYGQQLWQTDNGLPQNAVHAIHQTQDGYLWLATDGGLVRFDGVDFTLFDRRSNPAMRSNLIGALAETADGSLWAATADGLLRRNHGSLTMLGPANGLPAGPIVGVLPAEKSSLWVITPESVAFGAENSFTVVPGLDTPMTGRDGAPIAASAPDGSLWLATAHSVVQLHGGRVRTTLPGSADQLAVGSDGTLWLSRGTELFHYQQGALAPLPLGRSPISNADAPIRILYAGSNGTIYIVCSQALGILSPSGALVWKSAADGLPAGRVLRLFEDRQGALWIDIEGSIARFAQGRFDVLHARSGAAAIEDFYEDREGNLWLGTDAAGLLELREQRFTTFTTADGLPGDVIRTVLAGRNGVWAGTDGGGLAHFNGSAWQTVTTREGLASNTILSLAAERDDSLAVGTPDGLDRLANGHAAPAQRSDTLPDDFVRSLLYDPSDNSLWIGTRRGLAHRTGSGITLWTRANGLGSDLVGALALDRTRSGASPALWIGTRGGLSHLANGHISTLTTRDGLSSDVITALYQDTSGSLPAELWIGTNGGGLNLLHDGRITAFPSLSTGLPEVIHAIVEDARGDLWLASATGIYRVPRRQLEAFAAHTDTRVDVASYGVADGMRINECSSGHPAAVRTPDGSLWFATLRGISVTNPEHQQENRLPPPVVIENVTVDDQTAGINRVPEPYTTLDRARKFLDQVTVRPNNTRLALHYAGLSFVAPARVRYRYRLEGFDPKWIDAGARRVAYYTNIPPGNYTFRVLAANNDGVWNETGASLEIRVLPHFWQTWWFRILLGFAVLFTGYEVYRMRLRNVELRFNAVLAERTRIAREIHDTLAQDIVGISVQLEIVARLLGSSVDAARTQLDAARSMVKNSLTEARSSIWNLRSASSAADDLPARIHRAVTQTAAKGTARLRFQVRGTYRAAPPQIEDQLLRVSQEAVNNAIHHAEASAIDVTLGYDAHAVELSIDDDGHGFVYDPQTFVQGGHFGLKGIEERAAEMGGTLRIDTQPGKGSRISLRVDIP